MDPISATAPILSVVIPILKICFYSAQSVKRVWDAPKELQELFSEILQLISIVDRLSSLSDVDTAPLQPAITRLYNARKLFQERLSKTQKDSGLRFKRRSWVKNHGRIRQATKDVAGARQDLMASMVLMNLSSLTAMRNDHNDLFSRIHEHEQALSAVNHTSNYSDLNIHSDHEQSGQLEDILDAASQFSEDIADALHFVTPRGTMSVSGYSLESSPTFYPEQYVLEGPCYERITVFSMSSVFQTATSRIDKYFLLFARDARHWSRVIVTAKVPLELPEVSSPSYIRSIHTLPGQLQPQLEAVMDKAELYESVTSIRILVQLKYEGLFAFNEKTCKIAEDSARASVIKNSSSEHLEKIRCRGLAQYLESEVVVLAKIAVDEYLVFVESQHCIQKTLPFTDTTGKEGVDEFLADMNLLLVAQGCRWIVPFRGVVLSDDRTQICSYLLEYRGQSNLIKVFEKARIQKMPIPWEQRMRWIWQVITAVAEIHKRGSVIGCLEFSFVPVDSDGNILLDRFKSTGSHLKNQQGELPPEFRQATLPKAMAYGQAMTMQSDLFCLGLFVWRLVEHNENPIGAFCLRTQCQILPRYRCTASHSNPIHLPHSTNQDVPAYINMLISHCRQEDPSQRKPATVLLELLSPDAGRFLDLSPTEEALSSNPTDITPADMKNVSGAWVICDSCGRFTIDEHYHCGVCVEGDFDLCPDCVAEGVHCYDAAHKLSRRVCREGKTIDEPNVVEVVPAAA